MPNIIKPQYCDISKYGDSELKDVNLKSIVQVVCYTTTQKDLNSLIKSLFQCNLPETGQSVDGDDVRIQWVGPYRYHIVSLEKAIFTNLKDTIPITIGAVIDLSHARAVFSISGKNVESVLASAASIDFKGQSFVKNSVVSTVMTHIPIVLDCKYKENGNSCVEIYVYTSFAKSFHIFITETLLRISE